MFCGHDSCPEDDFEVRKGTQDLEKVIFYMMLQYVRMILMLQRFGGRLVEGIRWLLPLFRMLEHARPQVDAGRHRR